MVVGSTVGGVQRSDYHDRRSDVGDRVGMECVVWEWAVGQRGDGVASGGDHTPEHRAPTTDLRREERELDGFAVPKVVYPHRAQAYGIAHRRQDEPAVPQEQGRSWGRRRRDAALVSGGAEQQLGGVGDCSGAIQNGASTARQGVDVEDTHPFRKSTPTSSTGAFMSRPNMSGASFPFDGSSGGPPAPSSQRPLDARQEIDRQFL